MVGFFIVWSGTAFKAAPAVFPNKGDINHLFFHKPTWSEEDLYYICGIRYCSSQNQR